MASRGPETSRVTITDNTLNVKVSSASRLHRGSIAEHSPLHVESKVRRKQSVHNVALTPTSGQQLPASAMKEQNMIAQLIVSIIGARLPDKVL